MKHTKHLQITLIAYIIASIMYAVKMVFNEYVCVKSPFWSFFVLKKKGALIIFLRIFRAGW